MNQSLESRHPNQATNTHINQGFISEQTGMNLEKHELGILNWNKNDMDYNTQCGTDGMKLHNNEKLSEKTWPTPEANSVVVDISPSDTITFGPDKCGQRLETKVKTIANRINTFMKAHKRKIKFLILLIVTLLYLAYFIYSLIHRFGDEGSIRLLWMTCAVVAGVGYSQLMKYLRKRGAMTKLDAQIDRIKPHSDKINWVLIGIITVIVVIYVIVDIVQISKSPYNLVSLTGIILYVLILFIFSTHPFKINWITVGWGLCLQFIFAMLILRTRAGLAVFEWIGDRVTTFFNYTDEGSKFVFGDKYGDHYFAFKVLPVIIFFSAIVSVLYHLGVMQYVISKIAWIMYITMGTTAAESMVAAANIFLGQTEAPLLIKPFLPDMTEAELHSVMTSGFSTVSGGILAAYIALGVSARHLISASVMSAPAALAMSKLTCPETEPTKITAEAVANTKENKEGNLIEALSSGAVASVSMVGGIASNLIAFIATLYFINGVLTWFGNRAGVEELTFQMICSYVLWPLALVMGVEVADCRRVAMLIGIKTFLNEFIAYDALGVFIHNKEKFDNHTHNNGTWYSSGDDVILVNTLTSSNNNDTTVLQGGFISDRSVMIATYALCGFSNFSSMGIMLGGLASMAPERRPALAKHVLRAMIAGTVACFITACIAGLFYVES